MIQASTSTSTQRSQGFKMPGGMQLGAPTLRIRDLQSALAFYENELGLKAKQRFRDSSDGLEVVLLGFRAGGEPILVLKHDPNAKRTPHSFAGLYHYAVLVPDRESLASTYLAIGSTGTVYDGFADHGFSEALYLHDNERNGIEIYADRPRKVWPDWNKLVAAFKAGDPGALDVMGRPLDLESLLRELNGEQRRNPSWFPRRARIGHVHLRVTNLERSVKFYNENLGFDIGAYLPEIGAAFVTVAGYHHRIGLNTWHSRDGKAHEPGQAGLENFTIQIPHSPSLDELARQLGTSLKSKDDQQLTLTDPDGIEVRVETRMTDA